MGYMGAFAGDQVTGYVVDRSHTHGWRFAIFVWAGWAFAAALAAGLLWYLAPDGRKLRTFGRK
jgi:ABC-type multidrug transport system permease subunit